MNKALMVVLVVVGMLGMWVRVQDYRQRHPDNDELYELQQIQKDMRFRRVLDRGTTYGDHTSFPGEFILYHGFLKGLDVGLVELKSLGNEKWEVGGVNILWFWKLAAVKGLVCILGLVLMGVLCYKVGWTGILGMCIYCFNDHMVYHGFDIRPYSVLPVLALLNIFLCSRRGLEKTHFFVVLLTCVYHAYGPMIAFLPMVVGERKKVWFWISVPIGLLLWGYYASFNMFGMAANAVQSVVSPYQYFKPSLDAYLVNFLGKGWMYITVVPMIAWSAFSRRDSDLWFYFLFLIILPLLLIAVVDIKTSYWIHPRQWIWVIPFFGLWVSLMAKETLSCVNFEKKH